MNTNKRSGLRILAPSELNEITGGQCTCGSGGGCVEVTAINNNQTQIQTNCSGDIVGYFNFQRS